MICGRKIEENYPGGRYFCNAAVLGEYLEISGHKTCVDNVDNIVVIPNRIRLMMAMNKRNKNEN